jgi:hypothetical protein
MTCCLVLTRLATVSFVQHVVTLVDVNTLDEFEGLLLPLSLTRHTCSVTMMQLPFAFIVIMTGMLVVKPFCALIGRKTLYLLTSHFHRTQGCCHS